MGNLIGPPGSVRDFCRQLTRSQPSYLHLLYFEKCVEMVAPKDGAEVYPTEVLAFAPAIPPPDPPAAPLVNTLDEVDGLDFKRDTPIEATNPDDVDEKSRFSPNSQMSVPFPSLAHTASHLSAARVGLELEEDAAPPPPPPLPRSRSILLAGLVTCTFVTSAMSMMSLNIALPTIQIELDMRPEDLQWVTSAFVLTSGCFLLLAGRMADVHGRKLVFLCGMSWFAIWNLIGGFMKNGAALVVARALAGSGVAMGYV